MYLSFLDIFSDSGHHLAAAKCFVTGGSSTLQTRNRIKQTKVSDRPTETSVSPARNAGPTRVDVLFRNLVIRVEVIAEVFQVSCEIVCFYAETETFSLADKDSISPRRRPKYNDLCAATNMSNPRNMTRRMLLSRARRTRGGKD